MTNLRSINSLYISFCLVALTANCSIAQDYQTPSINIEDIKIGTINIVRDINSANKNGYYKYVNKRSVVGEFGQPGQVQTRNDDLMETEVLRMKYGASYVEFFDQSFGEGSDQDEYSLFNIELHDAKVWLRYKNNILKVGEELPIFYEQVNDKNEAIILLRRGLLNQVSDYMLKIQFEGKKVSSITGAFD